MDDKDHDDEVYETAIDPTFVKEKIQILENDDQPLSYTQSNIESFIEACEVLCDLSIMDSQINLIYESNIISILMKHIKTCTETIPNGVSRGDINRIIEISFSIISNLSSSIDQIIYDISKNTSYIDIIFDSYTQNSDPSVLVQIIRFLIICVSQENIENQSIWVNTLLNHPVLLEYSLLILNNTLDHMLYEQVTQFIFYIILNDDILEKIYEFKCIDIIFNILKQRRKELPENCISNSLRIIEYYSYLDNKDYIPQRFTKLLMKISYENNEDEELLVSCLVILTNMHYNSNTSIDWESKFIKLIVQIILYRESSDKILLECTWKILEMLLSQAQTSKDISIPDSDFDELIQKSLDQSEQLTSFNFDKVSELLRERKKRKDKQE